MLISLSLAVLLRSVLAQCECGYVTNAGDVWQARILTTFDTVSNNATAVRAAFFQDWNVTDIVRGDTTDNTPYQIHYSPSNVLFPTTAVSSGLQLIARGYNDSTNTAPTECGQITTLREDILHGSFRSRFSVSGGAGAVAGFFSYADDSNENDIEILTSDLTNTYVHFTNQPSDTTGATYEFETVGQTPYTVEKEYRFDWKSSGVQYFVDNVFYVNITEHPSAAASQILMNSWSNGGPFTSGPPTSDVTLSVSRLEALFNSSDASVVAAWQKKCTQMKTPVCNVDQGQILQYDLKPTVISSSIPEATSTSSSSSTPTTSSVSAATTSASSDFNYNNLKSSAGTNAMTTGMVSLALLSSIVLIL